MTEDFFGPYLKLARADSHISDLIGFTQQFLRLQTYKAIAEHDTKPGWIAWVARGEEPFSHVQLSPFVGDAIHNLRDSLDLAMSVLMRNAGESDVNVYFPTGDSENHFLKTIGKGPKAPKSGKVPNFPSKVIKVLEARIEPYLGGHGHWLRTLNLLAISDKHRIIVPTVFGVNIVNLPNSEPIQFIRGPATVKDGSKLFAIRADQLPDIKVGQEASLTLSIEFDEGGGLLRGWTIVDGLIRLKNVTEEALRALEDCL